MEIGVNCNRHFVSRQSVIVRQAIQPHRSDRSPASLDDQQQLVRIGQSFPYPAVVFPGAGNRRIA